MHWLVVSWHSHSARLPESTQTQSGYCPEFQLAQQKVMQYRKRGTLACEGFMTFWSPKKGTFSIDFLKSSFKVSKPSILITEGLQMMLLGLTWTTLQCFWFGFFDLARCKRGTELLQRTWAEFGKGWLVAPAKKALSCTASITARAVSSQLREQQGNTRCAHT